MDALNEIRQILELAQGAGLTEVEWVQGDLSFSATLAAKPTKKETPQSAIVSALPVMEPASEFVPIKASCVGYFRVSNPDLGVGAMVEPGQVVASIAALGLINDVESDVSGQIVESLVSPDQPVQYGQILFRVKKS